LKLQAIKTISYNTTVIIVNSAIWFEFLVFSVPLAVVEKNLGDHALYTSERMTVTVLCNGKLCYIMQFMNTEVGYI
jgi:hypothetical protein